MEQRAAPTLVPASNCGWIYALYPLSFPSAKLVHLERIRIYRVGFDISTWDILVDRLQQPAPRIEYLDINHIDYRTCRFFHFPIKPFRRRRTTFETTGYDPAVD